MCHVMYYRAPKALPLAASPAAPLDLGALFHYSRTRLGP
jgi:hypothetical protein